MPRSLYAVLGVDEDADAERIRRAYRERARKYHPDVNDHPRAREQFTAVTTARDVLLDAEERAAYDRMGHSAYVAERLSTPLPDVDFDDGREDATDGQSSPGIDATGLGEVARGRDERADEAGAERRDSTASARDSGTESANGEQRQDADPVEQDASEVGHDAEQADPDYGPNRSSTGSTSRESTAGSDAGPSTGSDGGPTSDESTHGSERGPDGPTADGEQSSPAGTPTAGSARRGADAAGSQRDPGANAAGRTAAPRSTTGDRGSEGASQVSWESARRRAAEHSRRASGHLTASYSWIPVVLGAVLYGLGLGRYLRANRTGFAAAFDAVTGADPLAGLVALHQHRFGVQSPPAFVEARGGVGPEVTDGTVLLGGAVAFPVVVGLAIWLLRRRTNWQPSWSHLAAALGPLTAFALAAVASAFPGVVPLAVVPVWVDGLLLVLLPWLAVLSYLLNRFVLVMPLVRID